MVLMFRIDVKRRVWDWLWRSVKESGSLPVRLLYS